MAYTITVLSWGLLDYTNGYTKAGAVEEARKAIKWGTDYLLKAHVSQNTLYGQVGNGGTDHSYWGRPEDMTMYRPAYKIDSSSPGSDLAAETAAALAAASLVFKTANPSYSSTLLKHAKQLYSFADTYRGKYSDSIGDANNYYSSGSYNDELVWGAIWLYKATGDQAYLTKAEQYYDQFELLEWDGRFDWDSKISGVEVLLGQITKNSKYTNKVKGYCDWMVNNQQKTSKGLIYIDTWGTLRHAANVAFICLEAASAGINTSQYRSFAQKQINYMLGDAGRSYVVGYGNNPPSHEQHRSRLVQLFMSYSPCGTCTDAIIPFTEKRPNCNVCIAFSCLYRHKKEEVHRDGLRQLNAEPRISIKVFTKIEWKTLAEATGRQYRGNKERDVWDKKWQLELNNILSYEDEPKVFTTVKKPELELSVSNLPSIVPDLPQELGGNARTVLNKPKEITSTSNKAKGKLFQVQPGGKKNNMVKNGVFPGDSAVSKSSSLQDQNRPNEISPKSTDHTQPQKEHTVIDIPEPKADQEQAVHPKKRRKEMIAIIIFVILISLAIILLIVLGQWS